MPCVRTAKGGLVFGGAVGPGWSLDEVHHSYGRPVGDAWGKIFDGRYRDPRPVLVDEQLQGGRAG
jgi:hypothetical protein